MGLTVEGLMAFVWRAAALAAFFARPSFGIATSVSSLKKLRWLTMARDAGENAVSKKTALRITEW